MINFELIGIKIAVVTYSQSETFKDAARMTRHRLAKETTMTVDFWGFKITQKNFTDLTAIKSVLQYWMNSYWRRGGQNGDIIKLNSEIDYLDQADRYHRLVFEARQKNGRQSLHICFIVDNAIAGEAYLNCQHVMQLDLAMGKGINLIRPFETDLPAKKILDGGPGSVNCRLVG